MCTPLRRTHSLRLIVPLLGALANLSAQDCQPGDKVLLTGSSTGYYFKFGKALAKVANREKNLHLCAQTRNNTLDNVEELNNNGAAFGIAQSDVFHDALYGHPKRFSEHPARDVRIVSPLYEEVVHILVRPHLNISHLGELKGKAVGLGPPDSGTEFTARHILNAAGLQDDVAGRNFQPAATPSDLCAAAHQLMDGTLDAFFKVTVVPSVDIQDALKSNSGPGATQSACDSASELRLLPLDHELAERLVRDGSYHETLIQKDEYEQSDSTLTVGVKALLLAGKSASDSDVRNLAWVVRFRHHAIDEALQEIVEEEHTHAGGHAAGNLPQLSLLNVPMAALDGYVHPQAREFTYHWWRDSWLPELPSMISVMAVIFALGYWQRARLGRGIELQPNLAFGIITTMLMWLVAACVFYHYEWEVNEHYNSLARSLASTFLYLTSLSKYSLLTQDAQSFAQSVKWISVVVLGGFASPLLKQGMEYLVNWFAKSLQTVGSDAIASKVHVMATVELNSDQAPPGDGEMPASMAPGAD